MKWVEYLTLEDSSMMLIPERFKRLKGISCLETDHNIPKSLGLTNGW